MSSTYHQIRESAKNFSLETDIEITEAQIDAANGELQTSPADDLAANGSMSMERAVSIFKLAAMPLFQEILDAQNDLVSSFAAKAKDVRKSRDESGKYLERTEGVQAALLVWGGLVSEAAARIENANSADRLALTPDVVRVFEAVMGKPATAKTKSFGAPVVEALTSARRYTQDEIDTFTRDSIKGMEQVGKK